jgi:hypothetical protein
MGGKYGLDGISSFGGSGSSLSGGGAGFGGGGVGMAVGFEIDSSDGTESFLWRENCDFVVDLNPKEGTRRPRGRLSESKIAISKNKIK